jgi:hypothetical protein
MPGRRVAAWTLGLLLLMAAGCSTPRDPIWFNEGTLIVENQSSKEWRNVRVTVNDHFTGGAQSVGPGGRLTAPLGQLQTGFGQRFDRGRMGVKKVEVTATDSDGNPVRLLWSSDRKGL